MSKLTVKDLLTSSGRFPEREKDKECTQEVINNATNLVKKINGLLAELGIDDAEFSSGFRPSQVNLKTLNASKRSLHMLGKAGDLLDDQQQTLAHLILSRPDLLKKYGLWIEHPDSTRGKNTNWAHLDDSDDRKDRPIRVFKP